MPFDRITTPCFCITPDKNYFPCFTYDKKTSTTNWICGVSIKKCLAWRPDRHFCCYDFSDHIAKDPHCDGWVCLCNILTCCLTAWSFQECSCWMKCEICGWTVNPFSATKTISLEPPEQQQMSEESSFKYDQGLVKQTSYCCLCCFWETTTDEVSDIKLDADTFEVWKKNKEQILEPPGGIVFVKQTYEVVEGQVNQ